MKPVKRSKARIRLGKAFYTYQRYLEWYFGKVNFARKKEDDLLPYIYFTHKTPLVRKLKDVDMWMQYNKVINLNIAVKQLNKVIIQPNETFSYWKLLGKPTRKKGYVDGMVLFYGKMKPGLAGGLCQLSNLIYWMTLHTPLTVTERYRHSFDVFPDANRTQPFGSGATCVYNYRDLRILNETKETYQLHVYLTDDYLVGEWRTDIKPYFKYEVYESKHWITHEDWGGYMRHNRLNRKIFSEDGKMLKDEWITENHAIMMYQPLLAGESPRELKLSK